jgi:hypothetical protein
MTGGTEGREGERGRRVLGWRLVSGVYETTNQNRRLEGTRKACCETP